MIDLYKIEGTDNICQYDIDHHCYNTTETWPTFQEDYLKFKNSILQAVKEKKPLSFLRVADGETGFLNRNIYGNMSLRHLSKSIDSVDLEKFWDGIRNCDYISTQLYTHFTENFRKLITFREIDLPMEFIYSIISNKWIFKNFPKSIGIIGGENKLKLIKRMMEHKEYRDYLGVDFFSDYISVKERFLCDDTEDLEKNLSESLKNSKSEIFLIGIGISKLAVIHKLKNYKNAVYIDVGCGISALAGTTSLERPYFGGWVNYKLEDYDYSQIDQMDYAETAGKNEYVLKNKK